MIEEGMNIKGAITLLLAKASGEVEVVLLKLKPREWLKHLPLLNSSDAPLPIDEPLQKALQLVRR